MSLLSTERVHVYVGAQEVGVARVRGRWRRNLMASRSVRYAALETTSEHAARAQGLIEALASADTQRGGARVLISSRLTRFAVLAANPEIGTEQEQRAYAAVALQRRFGETNAAWNICTAELGGKLVAAAVDQSLVDTLSDVLTQHRLRPVSMRPIAVAAYNALRTKLRGVHRLVVAEPDCATIMRIEQNCCSSIQVHALRGDANIALEQMLHRDDNLLGREQNTAVFCVADTLAEQTQGSGVFKSIDHRLSDRLGRAAALCC